MRHQNARRPEGAESYQKIAEVSKNWQEVQEVAKRCKRTSRRCLILLECMQRGYDALKHAGYPKWWQEVAHGVIRCFPNDHKMPQGCERLQNVRQDAKWCQRGAECG